MDQLKLTKVKLQSDPGSSALEKMDYLFTTEELVNGNPFGVTMSKDANRKVTVQVLDTEQMKFI